MAIAVGHQGKDFIYSGFLLESAMTDSPAKQCFVTSQDEVVSKIAGALGLGERIKRFSIVFEGGGLVKVHCTKYPTKEEIEKVAKIVGEEFQYGLVEFDAGYYIDGRPVEAGSVES